MNIYIHKPENGANKIEIEIAKIHAQSVKKYLDKLKCSKDQKIQLITEILKKVN